MRRRLILALKITVSLGLMLYVVWSVSERDGAEALVARLGRLDPWFVSAAIALHFAAVGAGILRYRLLLRARGTLLPLWWLGRTYLIGRFVGAFTPSTVGLDLYRTIAVARRTGRRIESAAAVLTEKLYGLLGLSIVTLVLVAVGAAELLGPSAAPLALAILAGASMGLVALGRPLSMKRASGLLPSRARARIDALLDAISEGDCTAADTAKALLLSIASHVATAAVFVATGLALGIDAHAATLLVVGNAIVIATLLPISVGGVGVREGVAVVLLAAVAVGPTEASLTALLGYATGQVPALVGGALQVLGNRSSEWVEDSPRQPVPTSAALPNVG